MPLNLRKNRECFQSWVKGYFRRLSTIQLFTVCKSLHWTKLFQQILRLFWKRPVYIQLMSVERRDIFFLYLMSSLKMSQSRLAYGQSWKDAEVIRLSCSQSVTECRMKFCNLSCIVCCRNSATTSPLDVAEILLPLTHWMLQKFCDHLYTGCCRNSATTHTLSVAEILQPLIHQVWQKFCDNSYAGCCRNSATTHSLGVAEILQPLIHQVLQKFCDHSYTGCCRNSATTHSLSVAEILQPLIHKVLQNVTECHRNTVTTHTLDVAEILHPLIH